MTERRAAPARAEPLEIQELRRLRADQPDLESAVDLQIELLQAQRRVQSRVPLPLIDLDAAALDGALAGGKPILQFEQIPIDWSDVRLMIRSTAQALRTHDSIEAEDYRRVETLARDAERLPGALKHWYERARPGSVGGGEVDALVAGLEPLLLMAMRPFLSRCADAVMARTVFAGWTRGTCPLCGGEPDLSVITPAAERLLICSRCVARWRFDQLACPFCGNADRARITSFATRNGWYRLNACDVCQRYIKAFDARHATRPVLPSVDTIATLPLDAAAVQRGYK
ncbi:MAG TPA: formate dehydrogenase accessory protein FdhE [Vicinamibacterales bacterium]|nr:formate dehydrogenase accessory protein FdhE [Vicinamibacterales bacterium]